jgi:hypothetical protein
MDGGANWMRSKYQGMPWFNMVRDIRIHPIAGDLIIASHGRGIYIVDEIQPLRELAKTDINKNLVFFPVKDYKYDFNPQVGATGNNIDGWVSGNKDLLPTFYYYLKQPPKDVVKIEIYDEQNKKVKDLSGTAQKGINKVNWNLNANPPKVAKGGFVAGSSVLYSGVLAPRVPVGKYKVVIKADTNSFSQILQILPNPAKGFTTESIKKINQQGMRLFKIHEKLAALVDSMDNTIAAIKKYDKPAKEAVVKMQQLDSMRFEILELKRQTVFFDEFKFRRRLSDLYLEIVFALEPWSASKEAAILLMENEYSLIEKKVYAIFK